MPHLRFKRGPINFYLAATISRQVRGVNSNLEDGNHVLFWDFDNSTLREVIDSLEEVSDRFGLPAIALLTTGAPKHWHAYCLTRCERREAQAILGWTRGLDKMYQAFGILRGYWTLRFTPKGSRKIEHVLFVPGNTDQYWDVGWKELTSGSEYWTKQL